MQIENKYIFISYSRKNKRIVNKVVSQIKETGFSVWIDTSGIESGEQFKQKIVDAIEGCEVFLYFASKESNCSPWTAKEIGIASSLKKRIIPIRLDNSPFNKEVLFDIVNINYIDLSDIMTRSNNISILISTLMNYCQIADNGESEAKRVKEKLMRIKTCNTELTNNVNERIKLRQRVIVLVKNIIEFIQKPYKEKLQLCIKFLKSRRFWTNIIILLSIYFFIIGAYRLNIYVRYACTKERIIINPAKSGNILAHDGRILSTYEPMYDVHLDCTISDAPPLDDSTSMWSFHLDNAFEASYFAHSFRKSKRRDSVYLSPPQAFRYLEKSILPKSNNNASNNALNLKQINDLDWYNKAKSLSKELANILLDKTAEEYFLSFVEGRQKGRKYVKICENVDQVICDTLSKMPLLREGKFRGGLIIKQVDRRVYPYGDLAKRTLGYSKNSRRIGIDGYMDSIVRGFDGRKIIEKVNFLGIRREKVINETPKIDGADILTTISIQIQQEVDKVLRNYVQNDTTLYGGTVVIMDVKTGAIRAMSNIEHKARRNLEPVGEYYNLAIGYKFEPGSILGAASLISFLQEYGHMYQSVTHQVDSIFPFASAINRIASLNNAYYRYNYQFVHSLIQDSKYSNISAIDGVSQSNPYVLAGMSLSEYGALDRYLYKLQNLGLTDDMNFELKEPGGRSTPRIGKPTVTDDYNYFLASLGCGYGIAMTPLQILTFYNTIANKGTKVKPYVIESIDNSSRHTYRHSLIDFSSAIDEKIISQIDSVMRYAVQTGNCGIIGKAKGEIAGLAGHSLHHLGLDSDPDSGGYITTDGKSRWNSSFVGYFPVSDPKYSIICTIVTYKTDKPYPGNDIPAKIVSEIYNSL